MDQDPYSLSALRDIVVPEPPPLWPPAPGVWVLLCIAVLVVFLITWRWRLARQRSAYRRAGLLLLEHSRTAYEVSVALKRVALAAFPRERVASLYGEDWAAFLQASCPQHDFSALVAADPGAEPGADLVELARTWIRQHRAPDERAGGAAG